MLFWSGAVAKIVSSRAKNRKSLISPTHGGGGRKKCFCVITRVAVRSKNGTERNGHPFRNGTERRGSGEAAERNGTDFRWNGTERNGFWGLKNVGFFSSIGQFSYKNICFFSSIGQFSYKKCMFF